MDKGCRYDRYHTVHYIRDGQVLHQDVREVVYPYIALLHSVYRPEYYNVPN